MMSNMSTLILGYNGNDLKGRKSKLCPQKVLKGLKVDKCSLTIIIYEYIFFYALQVS